MLAGTLKDGRRTCLSHMFEAVGAYKVTAAKTPERSWTDPAQDETAMELDSDTLMMMFSMFLPSGSSSLE